MSRHWKSIVTCLGLFALAVAGGCGQSGNTSQPQPAAAKGVGDATASGGGSPTSASAKPAPNQQYPVVLIETSLGNITVELDRKKAQLTVDNFLLYANASFYDQTIIHQVYKDKGILAGGYSTNKLAKPARTAIRNEADNGLKNRRGTIAMIRQPDVIDSATSQFFINVADNPDSDYKDRTAQGYGYCVFGKVTDGMDVVDKINGVELRDMPALERTPKEPVVVKSIRRIR